MGAHLSIIVVQVVGSLWNQETLTRMVTDSVFRVSRAFADQPIALRGFELYAYWKLSWSDIRCLCRCRRFQGDDGRVNRGAALDAFYQSGYSVILHQPSNGFRVEGLFVSDCGILFVSDPSPTALQLETLLTSIESLNRRCFERAVSVTTSVVWANSHITKGSKSQA